MHLLPIVERELRVTARKGETYWLRCVVAALVLLVWLGFVAASKRHTPAHQMGRELFTMLSIMSLGLCLMAGIGLTADCISSEKREGTLGLLFLTPLNSADVVLGKLAATSLHALYALLAIFPILALSLFFGGTTAGEMVRVMLVLVGALGFSLAAGLLVSSLGQDARVTLAGTLLLIALPTGLFPALGTIWHSLAPSGPMSHVFYVVSPGFTLRQAFEVFHRADPEGYWQSLAVVFFMTIACLVVACFKLPAVRQEKADTLRNSRWQTWWQHYRFGSSLTRASLRRQLIDWNPFHWLTVRDFLPAKSTWTILSVFALPWFLVLGLSIINTRFMRELFTLCLFTAYGLHFFFKCVLANEATRQLSEDRRSGALELLMTTPLSGAAMIEGQWASLRRHFKKPLFLLTVINCCLMASVIVFAGPLNMHDRDQMMFLELFVGGLLALGFDFYALSWLGMEAAMRVQSQYRALFFTLGRVIGLPWLAFFLVILLSISTRLSQPGAMGLLALWFLFGYMNSLFTANRAQAKLRQDFRSLATRP